MIGYYDGMAVRVSESLQKNQKVIVIPIEYAGESLYDKLQKREVLYVGNR